MLYRPAQHGLSVLFTPEPLPPPLEVRGGALEVGASEVVRHVFRAHVFQIFRQFGIARALVS